MKKGNITMIIVMLMILTVGLYFISGTYARYADSRTGKTTVDVAKWQVAITDGTKDLATGFTLPFTIQTNPNVVAGKIAPETTAIATIELDLVGTEVAVDFGAKVTDTALQTIFGNTAKNVTLTTKVTGANENATTGTDGITTIALPNGEAFGEDNGKITITMTLTWNNVEASNADDTTVGIAGRTLELPVELTLQQHLASDVH